MVKVVGYNLWVDLETTGLESTSSILEVGVLLTRNEPPYEVVDSYTAVVRPEKADWRSEMNGYVTTMHTNTGLLADLDGDETATLAEVEDVILLMLDAVGVTPSNPAYLAGSGVSHFDQRVIAAQMPKVNKRLRYATLDVGVLRRMLESAGRTDLTDATYGATFTSTELSAQPHRAFADIHDHLNEFRTYVEALQAVPGR